MRAPSEITALPGWGPTPLAVEIHYLRLPDRSTVYRQKLIYEDLQVKVTLARYGNLDSPPLVIDGDVVLDGGAKAVWFTFPGAWHDIGIFHRLNGRPTGIYANVITPCTFAAGGVWATTDLFLDLWIPGEELGGGISIRLLDEDELTRSEGRGEIPGRWAQRARSEAQSLIQRFGEGRWPPPIVTRWPTAAPSLKRNRAGPDRRRSVAGPQGPPAGGR